jgi:hypothetical protein
MLLGVANTPGLRQKIGQLASVEIHLPPAARCHQLAPARFKLACQFGDEAKGLRSEDFRGVGPNCSKKFNPL